MNEITNAEAALLGLLAEKPRHAYHLEKEVEYRDMRSWTDLSMSSIYKLLRGLEKRGLVESRTRVTEDNRTRKVYQLTKDGVHALREKVKVLLREPDPGKQAFHVGIYNSSVLDIREVRDSLATYRRKLMELVEGYTRLQHFLEESDCPGYRLAVSIRPRYLLEAEIRWVDDYLKQL